MNTYFLCEIRSVYGEVCERVAELHNREEAIRYLSRWADENDRLMSYEEGAWYPSRIIDSVSCDDPFVRQTLQSWGWTPEIAIDF